MPTLSFSEKFEQNYTRLRNGLESGFEQAGYVIHDHAKKITLAFLLLLVFLASHIPDIEIDTSTEGFLHEDDPFRLGYNAFRFQFGRDERVLLIVDSGSTIFDLQFLEKLKQLHLTLEEKVPKLQRVDSLINARSTYGENDQLIVKDFLENWPRNEDELTALRDRALNNKTYINQFLSRDGRYAMLLIENDVYTSIGQEKLTDDLLAGFGEEIVYTTDNHPPFLSGPENTEIVLTVEAIAAEFSRQGFHVSASGTPHMVDSLTRILMSDMQKFMLLSMAVIAALLWLVFRRLVMIFLPLIVSLISVISTAGSMSLLNIPMTSAAQIMPSFILTVGVSNAVHLFVIFFQRRKLMESKRDALSHALGHTGLAILMTSLTTIVGLLSFYYSSVKPVTDFGLITALGIFNALLASLVLLPALIAILPLKEHKELEDHAATLSQRILMTCGRYAVHHPRKVITGFGVLLILSLALATQMRFSHNPLVWFPEDDPFRITTELSNEKLGGGIVLEIMVDTGKENGLKDPDILKRLDKFQQYALQETHGKIEVKNTVSMVDIVKEIHQALNNNDPAFYAIPDDPELLAQEILLFENSGSDDLHRLVDGNFSKTHIALSLPFMDSVHYPALEQSIRKKLQEELEGKATYELTGLLAMMGETFNKLLPSLAQSYLMSFVLITLMMMLFVESLRLGLISMIPNLSPVIITIALMVILDFPLDAFTLLIGAIGLGLAVDDTLHFMNAYQRALRKGANAEQAVYQALSTAGEAMLFTSVVMSTAFWIYSFATMSNLQHFGILTAFCITMAFIADSLLTPAVMYLYARRQEQKRDRTNTVQSALKTG
jgi:predicted RND superfamily exporter protein